MGRALRTETTINDTCDFDVGHLLGSLEDLETIGLQANRRLLHVERLSHNATLGPTCLGQLNRPCESVSDPRVWVLLASLVAFRLPPLGFDNRQLGARIASLLGHNCAA